MFFKICRKINQADGKGFKMKRDEFIEYLHDKIRLINFCFTISDWILLIVRMVWSGGNPIARFNTRLQEIHGGHCA